MIPVIRMGIKELVYEWVANMYADSYMNTMIGNSVNEAMGNGSSSASVACEKVIDVCVNTICPAMSGIGIAIAITFFLIALLELSTTERLTLEFFIKFFSKLVVGVVLVTMSSELVQACIDFGNALTGLLSETESTTSMTREQVFTMYYNSFIENDLPWIFVVFSALGNILIINIVSLILVAIVYVVSFTRMLEMGVRGALMPIALGLLSDDGWRGAGGRYIRKFLAICSQGAVLVLIGRLTNIAMNACTSSIFNTSDGVPGTGSFVVLLGVAFASVSLMFKSIGIVNDVFGG